MVYLFYGSGWEFILISYFLNYECKKLEALILGLTLTKILLFNSRTPPPPNENTPQGVKTVVYS